MMEEEFIYDIIALYLVTPPSCPPIPTDNEFRHAMQMYINNIENPGSPESLKSTVNICTLLNNFYVRLNSGGNNLEQFTPVVLARVRAQKKAPKWDYLIDKALGTSI